MTNTHGTLILRDLDAELPGPCVLIAANGFVDLLQKENLSAPSTQVYVQSVGAQTPGEVPLLKLQLTAQRIRQRSPSLLGGITGCVFLSE
jgi:hypothetical protein